MFSLILMNDLSVLMCMMQHLKNFKLSTQIVISANNKWGGWGNNFHSSVPLVMQNSLISTKGEKLNNAK